MEEVDNFIPKLLNGNVSPILEADKKQKVLGQIPLWGFQDNIKEIFYSYLELKCSH